MPVLGPLTKLMAIHLRVAISGASPGYRAAAPACPAASLALAGLRAPLNDAAHHVGMIVKIALKLAQPQWIDLRANLGIGQAIFGLSFELRLGDENRQNGGHPLPDVCWGQQSGSMPS